MPGVLDVILFAILPYVSAALLISGLIYRGLINPFAWTARSTQFFERPALGAAILAFHWGVILLFVGHILGLIAGLFMLPSLITVFYWLGLVSGGLTLYGATLAMLRRIMVAEVRAMSRAEDYIILLLLFTIAGVALFQSLANRLFGVSLNVAPWISSVFALQPDVKTVAGLPLLNKIHILVFLILLGYWPYTKLVHVWAFPWRFVTRPRISMRTYCAVTPAPEMAARLPKQAGEAMPLPEANPSLGSLSRQ